MFSKSLVALVSILLTQSQAVPSPRPDFKWPEDLSTPFPYPTSFPINIDTDEVSNTTVPTDLTITVCSRELQVLNNTGIAVTSVPLTPHSGTSISGGFLHGRYSLIRTIYFWNRNVSDSACNEIDDKGTPLQVEYINKNDRYATFDEAVRHRDGLLILEIDVKVSGNISNPNFDPLCFDLSRIPKSGDVLVTPFSNSVFLQHINFIDSYYAYPGAYIDIFNDSTEYDAATVLVIPEHSQPTISVTQFESFLNLRNSNGEHYDNTLEPQPNNCRPVISGSSIHIVTLP